MNKWGSDAQKSKVARNVGVAASAALVILLSTGCSSKNYVRSQAGPLINQTNDLDAKTAADHRAIVDTDQRAQQGIATAKTNAAAADQHAGAAQTAADSANSNAQQAYNRVDSLAGTVAGLDQYKQVSDTSVTFKFDKATLTASDKRQLDTLASSLQSSRHYIVQLTGGTDSVGSAQYNYELSQKRADAVANYLQAKYGIAPHKFYLVGIGKDSAVASNRTAAGRSKNRRVDVQVLSNMQDENTTAAANTAPANPS
ncbi:OmpA family protein [Terriglobus aquaticus]|uniref:OmpA family protein n=1 Tax=Terriglobus aquaticus TaxID=940139 RepID=UPI0021DF7A96|nr:OmpA family protein [Terriglobus aquaticus]